MIYVLLNTGLSTSFTSRFFQIGGLVASFASVSKFCAEWHLFTSFNLRDDFDTKIPPDVKSALKAMLFFVPHVVFRTASIAFVAAFFRFYAFIPLSIFVIISPPILEFILDGEISVGGMFAMLMYSPLFIFTPAVRNPYDKFGRQILKTTMLISSLLLLPCILLIRLLPLLPTSTIHCTLGLSHINLNSDIPFCSPCFIPATNNLTTTNIASNDFTTNDFTANDFTTTSQTANNLTSTGDCLNRVYGCIWEGCMMNRKNTLL